MKHLFLDESGSHNLRVVDPDYPVFVLGGVIVESEEQLATIDEAVRCFKTRLFGERLVTLHTADITRARNGFETLRDPAVRDDFYADLNRLVAGLSIKVVACAIRKAAHVERYGALAVDPYMLSLGVLVERFCFDIGHSPERGTITVERRGRQLDGALAVAWDALRMGGTAYVRPATINRRITGLDVRPKSPDQIGLQLADLMVSPIARVVLGKRTHEDYRIVESKFRRSPQGRVEGAGLVILPKERGRGPLRSSQPRNQR
jgi:hypothetical protein